MQQGDWPGCGKYILSKETIGPSINVATINKCTLVVLVNVQIVQKMLLDETHWQLSTSIDITASYHNSQMIQNIHNSFLLYVLFNLV